MPGMVRVLAPICGMLSGSLTMIASARLAASWPGRPSASRRGRPLPRAAPLSGVRVVSIHGFLCVGQCYLQCGGVAFAGADADDFVDGQDEDLPVPGGPGLVGLDDGFEQPAPTLSSGTTMFIRRLGMSIGPSSLSRAMASSVPFSAPRSTRKSTLPLPRPSTLRAVNAEKPGLDQRLLGAR